MAGLLTFFPRATDFFPPTPEAYSFVSKCMTAFLGVTAFQWSSVFASMQAQGKTSTISRFNVSGRYGWAVAEAIGPINMLFILYTLPQKLVPVPASSTSIIGTGLPLTHEVLGLLYVVHYINRAIITPLFLAPSISPMHVGVALGMASFQFLNSSNLGAWLVYSTKTSADEQKMWYLVPFSVSIWFFGLLANILAETTLFDLRRGAAKRKAKTEGKAQITYDKVYVIPPADGWFEWFLYPHYTAEWVEWIGFWSLGGQFGLGWNTPAFQFVLAEIATMTPRAFSGREWYIKKFGPKAVGGRGAVLPRPWL